MKRLFLLGVFAALVGFISGTNIQTANAGFLESAGSAVPAYYDLTQSSAVSSYESIYGREGTISTFVTGDTYGIRPLIQDAASAYDITGGQPPVQTFNSSPGKVLSVNTVGGTGSTFVVSEALTALGGGDYLVQVEVTSVSSTGDRLPWVASGYTGAGGATLTAWRLDLGASAAVLDKLTPAGAWNTITLPGTMSVYDVAGANTGNFNISLDSSDAFGLSGLGVVGLGGANISGSTVVSSFQFAWTYHAVPEPNTLALLGLSSMGVALIRRRS